MTDEPDILAVRQAHCDHAALMTARIRQVFLHPAVYIDGGASIRDAAVRMKETRATSVLVRDGERIGIISSHDLRDAAIIDDLDRTAPVGPLADFDPVTLPIDDYLFNALVTMTTRGVCRIVIRDGTAIAGILEQVDMLGFMARQADIMTIQVDRAVSVEDLRRASDATDGMIDTLHANGTRIQTIAEIVTRLNRHILARLFELLASPELVANACLIVMGSEGRGEQILKTDQDNGLILRDGFVWPDLPVLTRTFTDALLTFGYPECQGGIMVCTPEWTRSLSGFRHALHDWVHRRDETALLDLAIFYDATAVAGDASLLADARRYFLDLLSDDSPFFSHFAKPAIRFDTPIGPFSILRGEQFDIKKAGIFPLVHGVRSLTLERGLPQTGTLARIQSLQTAGVLERAFAAELMDAFCTMQALRLKQRIEACTPGAPADNMITIGALNRMERDLLRDSFVIVKRFKAFLTYHFHLTMF